MWIEFQSISTWLRGFSPGTPVSSLLKISMYRTPLITVHCSEGSSWLNIRIIIISGRVDFFIVTSRLFSHRNFVAPVTVNFMKKWATLVLREAASSGPREILLATHEERCRELYPSRSPMPKTETSKLTNRSTITVTVNCEPYLKLTNLLGRTM